MCMMGYCWDVQRSSFPHSRLGWSGCLDLAGSLPGDALRVSGSGCLFLAFFWLPEKTQICYQTLNPLHRELESH